jgi:hypothetical protein
VEDSLSGTGRGSRNKRERVAVGILFFIGDEEDCAYSRRHAKYLARMFV